MFVRVVRNVVFLWFEDTRDTRILWDTEIGLFENGTVTGTRGRMEPPVIKSVAAVGKN